MLQSSVISNSLHFGSSERYSIVSSLGLECLNYNIWKAISGLWEKLTIISELTIVEMIFSDWTSLQMTCSITQCKSHKRILHLCNKLPKPVSWCPHVRYDYIVYSLNPRTGDVIVMKLICKALHKSPTMEKQWVITYGKAVGRDSG